MIKPECTLHLFLLTGKTFTFQRAVIVADTENEMQVEYRSVSDERPAVLRVRKEALAGWSVK